MAVCQNIGLDRALSKLLNGIPYTPVYGYTALKINATMCGFWRKLGIALHQWNTSGMPVCECSLRLRHKSSASTSPNILAKGLQSGSAMTLQKQIKKLATEVFMVKTVAPTAATILGRSHLTT